MEYIKGIICTVFAAIGGCVAQIYGGWNEALTTLCILMGIDFLTGIIVSTVFHSSTKTENGAYESKVGWKGLCRKGVTLLIVLIAARLDLLLDTTFCKDGMVVGFCVNETISILENAGLMGVKYPSVISKALEVLTKKFNSEEENDHEN